MWQVLFCSVFMNMFFGKKYPQGDPSCRDLEAETRADKEKFLNTVSKYAFLKNSDQKAFAHCGLNLWHTWHPDFWNLWSCIFFPCPHVVFPFCWQKTCSQCCRRTCVFLIFKLPFLKLTSHLKRSHPKRKGSSSNHQFSGATVDGWNPAPVEVGSFFPVFIGFHTSQVVVSDFSHQPYVSFREGKTLPKNHQHKGFVSLQVPGSIQADLPNVAELLKNPRPTIPSQGLPWRS